MPAVHPMLFLVCSFYYPSSETWLLILELFMQVCPCINNKQSRRDVLPVSGDTTALRAALQHILLTYRPTRS